MREAKDVCFLMWCPEKDTTSTNHVGLQSRKLNIRQTQSQEQYAKIGEGIAFFKMPMLFFLN